MARTEKNPERYTEATPIKNDVLQNLIGAARVLSASEIACALFVYRKTIGWDKKTDKISISQFMKALSVSKPTICKSLKTLKLVKICLLVKKGLQDHSASEWAFNENVDSWELVKKPLLVKVSKRTGKGFETQLVKKSRPTKRTLTKRTKQKEAAAIPSSLDEVKSYFEKKGAEPIEAEKFWNHYESNGWRVGKNKMKKWRAAVAGWLARNAPPKTPPRKKDADGIYYN